MIYTYIYIHTYIHIYLGGNIGQNYEAKDIEIYIEDF